MTTASLIEATVKSIILLLAMTGGFAYLTWYERKVLARIQVRVVPTAPVFGDSCSPLQMPLN